MATTKTKKERASKTARHKNRLAVIRSNTPVLLTQEQVAVLTGQDVTSVAHHENGTRGMTKEVLVKYGKLFKKETHEFFLEAASE